jgi:hypothetical protein
MTLSLNNSKLFGDGNSLHPRLADYTNKADIIYWSMPNQNSPICCRMCLHSVPSILLCIPCFWPHLLIFTPCLCGGACYHTRITMDTIVVLTSRSLDFIRGDGTVTSISLESIKSVETSPKDSCSACSVNRLIIDDGRTAPTKNKRNIPVLTTIWGHDNLDELRKKIMEAQDRQSLTLRQLRSIPLPSQQPQYQMVMQQQPMAQLGQPPMQQGYPSQPPMGYAGQYQPVMHQPFEQGQVQGYLGISPPTQQSMAYSAELPQQGQGVPITMPPEQPPSQQPTAPQRFSVQAELVKE